MEEDVSSGGHVEALLLTLKLQQEDKQPIGYLYVVAMESPRLIDGRPQQAGQSLRRLAVHQRPVEKQHLRLDKHNISLLR